MIHGAAGSVARAHLVFSWLQPRLELSATWLIAFAAPASMRLLQRLKRACLSFWHTPPGKPSFSLARPVQDSTDAYAYAGLQTLPKELHERIFQQLALDPQHALASTCRAFRGLWTQSERPRIPSWITRPPSPQEQWRNKVVKRAADRLARRLSIDIQLRTVQDTAALQAHAYDVPHRSLHFRLELCLGVAEMTYLLRQSDTFLRDSLGPAFGHVLGYTIACECREHGVNEEQALLCSLHLVHFCPSLSEAELDSLAAFVVKVPGGLEAPLAERDRWEYTRAAVSCSVTGPAGIRTTLPSDALECRIFYGSNLIDGGEL